MKLARPTAMRFDDGRTPVAVIEMPDVLRQAIKTLVRELGSHWPADHDEQGLLAEIAVAYWFRKARKAISGPNFYFGPGELQSPLGIRPPVDLVVWIEQKPVNIGVRSRKHVDLLKYKEVPYREARIREPLAELPHYIVATSVNELGQVAVWGAVSRVILVREATPDRLLGREHRFRDPAFVIPLRAFAAEELTSLLARCAPRYADSRRNRNLTPARGARYRERIGV